MQSQIVETHWCQRTYCRELMIEHVGSNGCVLQISEQKNLPRMHQEHAPVKNKIENFGQVQF